MISDDHEANHTTYFEIDVYTWDVSSKEYVLVYMCMVVCCLSTLMYVPVCMCMVLLFVNFYLHVATYIAMVVSCLSTFIYIYVPLCMFMCIVCQHHVHSFVYMHVHTYSV